jgi:uncharacterized protein
MPDDVASALPPADSAAGPARLTPTVAAAELLARLRVQYGELIFHQSRAHPDGAPMCYPQGELLTSESDVHLGDLVVIDTFSELVGPELADLALTGPPGRLGVASRDTGPGDDDATFTVPFWTSSTLAVRWAGADLTLDAVPGRASGFSVEAPEGVRFVVRARPAG